MSDLVRSFEYDQLNDRLIEKVTYDNSSILAANAQERAERTGFGKYKGNLVKAANVSLGDVERLKNLGYNILSPDPEEVRRALLYIQSEEKQHLCVDGTPFAKHRVIWQ